MGISKIIKCRHVTKNENVCGANCDPAAETARGEEAAMGVS